MLKRDHYTETLPAHNWHVPLTEENPLGAVLIQITYQITSSRRIVITNHLNTVRYDQWLVLEQNKVVIPYSGLEYTSIVDRAALQTDALHRARSYVWLVYKKDIAAPNDPF
jgi:hypothetical protein